MDVLTKNDYFELSATQQQFLRPEQAFQYQIIPKDINQAPLVFYIDELHHSYDIRDELELIFGKEVVLEKASSSKVHHTLTRYYRRRKDQATRKLAYNTHEGEDFLALLIREAHSLGSSDIHIEPSEERCRIRIRIDGKLTERFEVNKNDYPALLNKIKIRSKLDIAEKRLPQDGRIEYREPGLKFDIRVSILPTLYGEKAVLRLLSRDAISINLEALGFSDNELQAYNEGVKKPHGIILVSGPTGSGKTTTLYATLKQLNEESRNIMTVEDPIEYTLDGINQVQVKESIGLDFARAMKTFLRQDPDIIMLGEIRDKETAQMAIRAALTGHLVFSTIHTNSAWGTITRLIDMGVPSFLIANTLQVSLAQRLIRQLCPSCKTCETLEKENLPASFQEKPDIPKVHYTPLGCETCFYTGYTGRKAIYEIIAIDYRIGEAIRNNHLDEKKLLTGHKTLADRAWEVFTSGATSLEEVYSHLM